MLPLSPKDSWKRQICIYIESDVVYDTLVEYVDGVYSVIVDLFHVNYGKSNVGW